MTNDNYLRKTTGQRIEQLNVAVLHVPSNMGIRIHAVL